MIVRQLSREVEGIALDPLSVYEQVRSEHTYILESAEGGEKVARYSFIGVNPVLTLSIKDGEVDVDVLDPALYELKPNTNGNPFNTLRGIMEGFEFKGDASERFLGGLVGYLSYDIIRSIVELGKENPDTLRHPDCEMVLCRNNIIFDHVARKIIVTSNQFGEDDDKADEKIEEVYEQVLNTPPETGGIKPENPENKVDFSSNMEQNVYEKAVSAIVDYMRAGDIFQAVLSQRLEADTNVDPLTVYRALKRINPSPYMYLLDFGSRKIAGSSPEMLARVEGRKVVTYPIAGTRGRGGSDAEDTRLEKEMLADEKERAEHVMLVDLGRNDIGRVAEYCSVSVPKFMGVEKYSHVQHIVSEVVGTLKPECDEFNALESIFPAGTVSGAPKVRAMEIIDELEPERRGIYAGAVGYFSFNRNMDTAITIRTLVFEKGKVYAQAGAGIVADSKPTAEYKETLKKAGALLKAVEAAQ